MTKFTVFLLLTASVFSVSLANFDPNAFKQKFNSTISEPYKAAIGFFANNVLKPLAEAPIPKSSEQAGPLVTVFKASAGQFSTQLKATSQASDDLRSELDLTIESVVAEHSATEQQLNQKTGELQQVSVGIQNIDNQIAEAQNQVNAADKSLRHAEEAVRTEERILEKARNCLYRGKRNIFRKMGRFAKRVVNAPCHVVNRGGINRAKDGRARAYEHLQGSQLRLQNFVSQKNALVGRRGQLEQQRDEITQLKGHLLNVLQQLQQERDGAIRVGEDLKAVVLHLTSLFGKSQVLNDAVSKLIDMQLVLNPLQAIASQVTSYTGDDGDAQWLDNVRQILITSVDVLKQKLPQYPFIEVNL